MIELLAIEMPNIDNCLDYLIECAAEQNTYEEIDAVFTRIESNEGFTHHTANFEMDEDELDNFLLDMN